MIGYSISPSFSSSVTKYSLDVDNNVERVVIKATKADGNASVSGTGERSLSEGSNVFRIVVTAQNGSTKTYTLIVNVTDPNPIEVVINDKKYTIVKRAANIDKVEEHMRGKIDTNELMSDYFYMFVDTEKTGLPARTGYVYGYLKVKEYLENNNLRIKNIIDKDWKDILN